MQKLLDVTDRHVRRTQHLSILGVGALALVGTQVLLHDLGPAWAGWLATASAVGLLVLVAGVKQRWEVDYRGHRVRFENSAVTAERLYLDGGLVARGGVGTKMELRAPIQVGEGTGETLVALVDAGLTALRLRLFVEMPEGVAAGTGEAGATPSATLIQVPSTPGPSGDAPAPRLVSDQAVWGGLVVAKQGIELAAAVIGLIGGLSALAGWLG